MAEKKKDKVIACPRDKELMKETVVEHAFLDICGKCGGTFFDSGEMFAAFGLKADPSYWDRPETGGVVRNGTLECSRCHNPMLVQDVKYGAEHVEIDRCGKCGGIWLDKGEVEKIMAIGEKLASVVDAEKIKAQEDLAKMGDVDFSPGLIAKFLAIFKKKS
jgi:Zn-finger nucleic acid-binding protein